MRGSRVPARWRVRVHGRARPVPLSALFERVRARLRLRRHLLWEPMQAAARGLSTQKARASALRRTLQ